MELPALTEPGRLWWLLAVLPAVWWLAQPPRPRRTLVTAHPVQWRLAQEALRRRPARFRALRWALLCAAAGCAALAAAGPRTAPGNGAERLVVLLDGSASMGARDGAGVRADDRARALVRERLARVPEGVEVRVLRLGAGGLQRWSGAGAGTLDGARAPRGELPDALADLAAAAAAPGTAVWTVTDGQGTGPLPGEGALSVLGVPADNAAIVDVELVDQWPAAGLRARVELVGLGRAPMSATLRVTGAVAAAPDVELVLAPDRSVVRELLLEREPAGGELRLELHADGDALPSDDVWTARLPALPQPRVALRADGDAVFARAAAAALADTFDGAVVDAAAGQAAGFLLAEGGVSVLTAGAAPMLTFGTASRAGVPIWPAPLVVDWDRSDPLLTGLDLSELAIEHALQGDLPLGRALVWGAADDGSEAPLAVLVEGAGTASVHFAFRLQDSNLGLLPAFPQLLQRVFRRTQPDAGAPRATAAPFVRAEADLRRIEAAAERPLPPLAGEGDDLSAWFACVALVLLALRAAVR
ncbi:MAG: hypothetical protein AB7O97_17880 [Planctomycetota bacterium]